MFIAFLNIPVAATPSIEEWITCLIYQVIHNNLVNIPLKYAYWLFMQMIIIEKLDSLSKIFFPQSNIVILGLHKKLLDGLVHCKKRLELKLPILTHSQ